jgi:UDP-glucose 6-dehydrogenase
VVEEAFGLLLAQELSSANLPVVVFDPSVDVTRELSGLEAVRFAGSARECIAQSAVVVLATPWKEFTELPLAVWARENGRRVIIDCWRTLTHLDGVEGIHYIRLGFGDNFQQKPSIKYAQTF